MYKMGELLTKYSIEEIILFAVVLGFAIKELVTFIDWAHERLRKRFDREDEHQEIKEQIDDLKVYLENNIDELKTSLEETQKGQEKMQDSIVLLMDSDRDDIKAWITEKHHYFCYEKGYIDDYSLETIEKRFKHYKDEGGNSFVEDFMNEIRALPKVSQVEKQKK